MRECKVLELWADRSTAHEIKRTSAVGLSEYPALEKEISAYLKQGCRIVSGRSIRGFGARRLNGCAYFFGDES